MIDRIKHSMRELKDTVLEIFQQVKQTKRWTIQVRKIGKIIL